MHEKQPFYMVPQNLVREYGFTVAGVYAVLLNKCKPPVYEITTTRSELAEICNLSIISVRRTLDILINIKLIERVTRVGKANTYRIVPIINARIHQQKAPASETSEQSEKKQAYGRYQHVLLAASQYSELVETYGEEKTKNYIQRVDEYCQQHDKHYSDCVVTIKKWIEEDKEKDKKSGKFSDEELQQYANLVEVLG